MPTYLSEYSNYDNEEARIASWYITGIKRKAWSIAKKQQNLKRREMLILNKAIYDMEGNSVEMIDIVADCYNMESKIEDKINIEQVLSKLTSKQQQVIKMIFFQELTEKGAAEKLGVSQPAAHKIKNRALKKMKTYMMRYIS